MKLTEVKSNFQVLLVPNYRAFRITMIHVRWIPRSFFRFFISSDEMMYITTQGL